MVGEVAPDFTLKDQDGKEFNLYKELTSKVMLVFYPKDDSPVCTRQLNDYQENFENFHLAGIKIFGINIESENSHKHFSDKCKIGFPLLADLQKTVSQKYDALNLLGLNKRKIVIVNTDKKIIFEKVNFPFNFLRSEEILKLLK